MKKYADKTGTEFAPEELVGTTVVYGSGLFVIRRVTEAPMFGVCLEGPGIKSFLRLSDTTVCGRMPTQWITDGEKFILDPNHDDSPSKTMNELLNP